MVGKGFVRMSVALATLTLIPVAAFAQAGNGIAGVVRDTTGAGLPGVTVESGSPALLEKVRTVVTDSQGDVALARALHLSDGLASGRGTCEKRRSFPWY